MARIQQDVRRFFIRSNLIGRFHQWYNLNNLTANNILTIIFCRPNRFYTKNAKGLICLEEIEYFRTSISKGRSANKFTCHYHGPHQILKVTSNNVKICPAKRSQVDPDPILVAITQLRKCPKGN